MNGQFEIIQHPNYSKNESQSHGDGYPCVYCGKHVNNPRYFVHLFYGFTAVTEEEAQRIIDVEGTSGDLGAYPIGSDCLKKHPEIRPYIIKTNQS